MRKCFSDIPWMVDETKHYPCLPLELTEFYAYVRDGGHSICCIPKPLLDRAKANGDTVNTNRKNSLISHNYYHNLHTKIIRYLFDNYMRNPIIVYIGTKKRARRTATKLHVLLGT
jgi:hypothetical protein